MALEDRGRGEVTGAKIRARETAEAKTHPPKRTLLPGREWGRTEATDRKARRISPLEREGCFAIAKGETPFPDERTPPAKIRGPRTSLES